MYENEINVPNKQVDFACYMFDPPKAEILIIQIVRLKGNYEAICMIIIINYKNKVIK